VHTATNATATTTITTIAITEAKGIKVQLSRNI
jgi:hypothetical protein